jgi:hypothetical protein
LYGLLGMSNYEQAAGKGLPDEQKTPYARPKKIRARRT